MSDEFSFEPVKDRQEEQNPYSANEPPIVASHNQIRQTQAAHKQVQLSNPVQMLVNSLSTATSRSKAYGAPRVFDLFTLLAITLAFALLFALLGLLAPALDANASELTLMISVFVTLIGLSQMWLFGSNNPRMASLVAGPVALIVVAGIASFRYNNWQFVLSMTVCFSLFLGSFAGYLGGAVVAGVFLLADKFRSRYMVKAADQHDASFDELQ